MPQIYFTILHYVRFVQIDCCHVSMPHIEAHRYNQMYLYCNAHNLYLCQVLGQKAKLEIALMQSLKFI